MANLILITGVMGAGKTLKAVSDLVDDIEQNEKRPIEEKRTYYSNITGLKINGIEPIPDDFDWRTTPDYSYIVIDEAQLIPRYARNRGKSHISVQELTLVRKRGHKIVFLTQAPNRLHQDILDVVQEHYHLDRKYGAKLATCYVWHNEVAKNPMGREAQRKTANKFLFTYPKKCFDYYESAQVANDGFKVKIPAKTLGFVALPFLCFGFSAYMWFAPDTQNMVQGKNKSSLTASTPVATTQNLTATNNPFTTVSSTTPMQPMQMQTPEQMEMTRVAFVMSTPEGYCFAKNSKGQTLPIDTDTCMKYANKQIPMDFSYTPTQTQYMGGLAPVTQNGTQSPQPPQNLPQQQIAPQPTQQVTNHV